MVNALGFNVVDSALWGNGRELALRRLAEVDIAAATILEAAHPKEALEFTEALERQHPKALIVYRKRPDHRTDAVAWQQLTPAEWVEFFRPQLERGYYGALFNESWVEPPTALVDWSLRVLDITTKHGWRTCHFKVSTGNPGGYGGESKLPPSDPRYRPDGYAAFKPLFERIAEINRPPLEKRQKPGAIVAPHTYCPTDGISAGNLDRHPLIWATLPGVDRRLLPIHFGEFGVAVWRNGQPDSNAGYQAAGMDGAAYARLIVKLAQEWRRDGVIPHGYCVGRTVSGFESKSFDVLYDDAFWGELKRAAETGALALPWWYGDEFVTMNDKPVTVVVARPTNLQIGLHHTVEGFPPGVAYRNIRSEPRADAMDIGDIAVGDKVKIYEIPSLGDNGQTWRFMEGKSGKCEGISGWVMITGMKLSNGYTTSTNPVVKPDEPKPVDPPAPPAPEPVEPPREGYGVIVNGAEMAAVFRQLSNSLQELSELLAMTAALLQPKPVGK